MSNWKNVAATMAALGLFHLSLVNFAVAAGNEPWNPTVVENFVSDLGVGAEIKLKLTDGRKIQGWIGEIAEAGFLVTSRDGQMTQVSYTEVSGLEVARLSYKGGVRNEMEVRRVVIGLGVAEHVMVKASEKGELRGHIRRIQSDSFTLEADNSRMPLEIAYSDVLQVGKNLSKGATIAIVAGVIAATVGIIAAAGGYGGGDGGGGGGSGINPETGEPY